MHRARREFLHLAAAFASMPFLSRTSWAETYPLRTVHLLVGFPAGGPADVTARLIAQWLSEEFGHQFIVENRPGAASNLATEAVARAVPDGYDLLLVNSTIAINATLYQNQIAPRDIEPVAGITRFSNVIVVNPALPIRSVPDLIAYAKANPGKLSMASSGNGTTIHLAGELFKLQAGIDMVHVPYRGAPPATADLIAGRVHIMFDNIPNSLQHIKTGKLRALAVTSAARSAVLPDLPAVAEYLPDFEASVFFGLGAPRSTPAVITERINQAVNKAFSQPKITSQFSSLGATVLPGSRADFGKLIADETEKWRKLIKSAGIRAG
jgi:tripartite-type tricarboxylate transporter receptor subunit TctC